MRFQQPSKNFTEFFENSVFFLDGLIIFVIGCKIFYEFETVRIDCEWSENEISETST